MNCCGPINGDSCDMSFTTHMIKNGVHRCDDHGLRPGSRAVVAFIMLDGNVLAIQRQSKTKPSRGIFSADYGLPGGKVEVGETDRQAVIREVAEETFAIVTDPLPVFVHSSFADTGRFVTAFVARLISDPDKIQGNGREGEPVWVPPQILLLPHCTYRNYNRALLAHLGVQL